MISDADVATAFVVATAAHLGFQATVSVLVYPALLLVEPEGWVRAHRRHSRTIAPLVAVLYAGLVVTSALVLLHDHAVAAWVGAGGAWGAMLVTAAAAAPTHAQLSAPDPALLRHLLRVDRIRAVLAFVAAAGAVMVTRT